MRFVCILLLAVFFLSPVRAQAAGVVAKNYGGRDVLVYVPAKLPLAGKRALVVVLHGGLGNARNIESGQSEHGLNMDAVAEKNGFLVAYLNGTRVARLLGSNRLGWNAGGGCCGLPAEKNVDDVGYIAGAVHHLVAEYGIDPAQVYGIGHSNGAMMTQRLMCETGLYAAAIAISGPLNLDVDRCPGARGKRILALHGVDDRNVPVIGGQGPKGLSDVFYKSEDHSQKVFTNSGAVYDVQLVQADHVLDHINAEIERVEGGDIPQKAVHYFGLLNDN